MANDSERRSQAEILERGHIYFMYRPRVGEEHPAGVADIERFYMALEPDSGHPVRLMVIGAKHAPGVDNHETTWAFVDRVSDTPSGLEATLQVATYETRTRGERALPAARPAGEGVYAIVYRKDQAHLMYALELPDEPDDVQKQLRIAPEASFALSIKNPEQGAPTAAGLQADQAADYPQALQERFRGRRFDHEHPKLLDYAGAEIVLIGARTNPEAAYGVSLEPGEEDVHTADILNELKMARSRHPVQPLIKGEWR